jgi:hypothetical protein
MKLLDLQGQRFGRLTVIRREENRGRKAMWFCQCDCGTTKAIDGEALRYGLTSSCGCFRAETTRARSLTHGASVGYKMSREYHAWSHAKGRCFNPTDAKYAQYGGRGITMCPAWAADFAVFLRDVGLCPDGMTLDRIDVDGNYEPGNVRWASDDEQRNNKQQTVWVTVDGLRLTLKQFAQRSGVPYWWLHAAVTYRGMTPHEAVASRQQ